MVELQFGDGVSSPDMPQATPSQGIPLWVPIIICAFLIVIPVSLYLAYLFYNRQPRRVDDQEATPAPHSPDIKWTDPFDARRPSTNKWTLTVPKWNAPVNEERRGSDGGFPPGTRHITFPDPTLGASVESLDNKVPSSPAPAIHVRYPTPPPAVHVTTSPRKRSLTRAI